MHSRSRRHTEKHRWTRKQEKREMTKRKNAGRSQPPTKTDHQTFLLAVMKKFQKKKEQPRGKEAQKEERTGKTFVQSQAKKGKTQKMQPSEHRPSLERRQGPLNAKVDLSSSDSSQGSKGAKAPPSPDHQARRPLSRLPRTKSPAIYGEVAKDKAFKNADPKHQDDQRSDQRGGGSHKEKDGHQRLKAQTKS